MIIKKFQANTETEAIMLAKEELGKDAIVMNIKTVSPKGIYKVFRKSVVEITAAVDDNVTYKPERPKVEIQGQVVKKPYNPDIIYDDEPFSPSTQASGGNSASETSAIEDKLNNLQSLLEKQMIEKEKETEEKKETKPAETNKNIACIQLIYNQLVSNEVDEKLSQRLRAT